MQKAPGVNVPLTKAGDNPFVLRPVCADSVGTGRARPRLMFGL